jgi:hypothetical protein
VRCLELQHTYTVVPPTTIINTMSDDSSDSDDDGDIPSSTDNDDDNDSSANDSNTIGEEEDIAIIPLLRNRGSMDDASDDDDDDDDDIDGDIQIFTIDELLKLGLRMVRYRSKRIRRAKRETNQNRFRKHFGSSALVCALIWEDLQTTTVQDARVPPDSRRIEYFLMAMHHLKLYPKEYEREATWDVSEMWGRDWVWYYLEKIQALKKEKITWPEDFDEDIWVLTVDGTHCWIQEPKHPTWSQDKDFFSHKYGKAGINYELAISLTESRLIWMNGPFKAGTNDVTIFKNNGLKQKLREAGKRGIGDGGYNGHAAQLSTPNSHDSKGVKTFKGRALKRHERFNGYTKAFDCLSGRFRHSVDRFATCFEAVCVICQYQIENGNDLYDILIEDMEKRK